MHRSLVILALVLLGSAACGRFSEAVESPPAGDGGAPDAPTSVDAGNGGGTTDAAADATPNGSAAYRALILADAPIAYWRLAEPGSAPSAADELGQHPAQLSAVPPTFGRPGVFGATSGSLEFHGGSAEYAATGGSFPFVGYGPFTVEAWLYLVTPPDLTYRFIAFHSGGSYSYGIYVQSEAGIGFEHIMNGQKTFIHTSMLPVASVWHHVVATRTGGELVLWVDGVPQNSSKTEPEIAETAGVFIMGAKTSTSPSLPAAARIAELAIYENVLDEERVLAHRAAGTVMH